MKYTVISIDDSRVDNKENIHANIDLPQVTDIAFCDARTGENINPELKLTTEWTLTRGEIGIWNSNLNVWKWAANNDEPLLVLEDDAIIDNTFMDRLNGLMEDVPDDYDFVSLWVPDDQEVDYFYEVTYDNGHPTVHGRAFHRELSQFYIRSDKVAKVYQGYSFVTTLYSKAGAQKLYDLAIENGMYTTADCFLFHQACLGNVRGYAPTPWYPRFIWHDPTRESLRGI